MNFVIKFDGGPLDGVYEFPNFNPGQVPQGDSNRLAAFMHLTTTNGEVRRASGGFSPAALAKILGGGGISEVQGTGATRHSYVNTERREEGDTIFVTAQYMNEDSSTPPELSQFTIAQLANELVKRPQFAGLVAFCERGPNGERLSGQQGEKISFVSRLPTDNLTWLLQTLLSKFGST